jgi:hypothetical protein
MNDIFDPVSHSMIASSSLPKTCAYTNGKLTSVSVTNGRNTWVKTITYNADGTLNTTSTWVQQ